MTATSDRFTSTTNTNASQEASEAEMDIDIADDIPPSPTKLGGLVDGDL